jgi:hypothetical protein
MMTIPEFDAFVESMAEGKNFELFDGTPLLMSNPSASGDHPVPQKTHNTPV